MTCFEKPMSALMGTAALVWHELSSLPAEDHPGLYLFIPGPPHAKMRHRTTTIAGRARSYDPQQNMTAQQEIRYAVREAMRKQGFEYTVSPVACRMTFMMPRPKGKQWKKSPSTSGTALEQKSLPAVGKDLDNMTKMLWDACNGVLWHDDRQVVSSGCAKVYAPTPDSVGILMRVWLVRQDTMRAFCEEADKWMAKWRGE